VSSETWTALIRFAPLTTLERVNSEAWKGTRTMYDSHSRVCTGEDELPLIVDHDDTKVIGVVRSLDRFEDVDGPWLTALARIYERPAWLKRNTPVSFGYGSAGTSRNVFGCEILRRGIVSEISLLSPGVEPAEPGAKVLTINRDETAALDPGDRVSYGGRMIYRPGIGQVLSVEGRRVGRAA
jgi:hypothetical protein